MFSFRSLKATTRMAAAAGAALTACALAVPAAYASTAPHSSAPAVRTVDISVPAAASSGFTANIPGPSADHNHERIDQWWYLRNGCVGTVITTTYVAAGGHCVNPQIKINGTKFQLHKPDGTKWFFCPKTTQRSRSAGACMRRSPSRSRCGPPRSSRAAAGSSGPRLPSSTDDAA